MSTILRRHNTRTSGSGTKAMMFAHGFGCDQNMWRFVAPAFEDEYRVLLFDHIGAGGSDHSAYDLERYASLSGYADDVVELARAAEIERGVFVGHSVSAMIGILAAKQQSRRQSCSIPSFSSAPHPATSMTGITSAASPSLRSRSFWSSSTAITWGGRR